MEGGDGQELEKDASEKTSREWDMEMRSGKRKLTGAAAPPGSSRNHTGWAWNLLRFPCPNSMDTKTTEFESKLAIPSFNSYIQTRSAVRVF
jgi:hypothetical protein